MKINKKFLGILLGLGIFSVFGVAVSARDVSDVKDKSKFVAVEYDIKNKGMKTRETLDEPTNYDNLTNEKDVVAFYIIMKKILLDNGLFNEKIKESVLNRITTGDGKKLKLTTELDLFFDDGKDANKFKEAISKVDLNKIEITKEDFDKAIEDFKEHYEISIKRDKEKAKRYESALEKGDKAVLEEDLAVAKKFLENLKEMKDKAKSREEIDNRNSDIESKNNQIKELKMLIQQLDGKEEMLKDFKDKIKYIKDESRKCVKNMKDFINFSEDSIKKIINLKYDDVKGLKQDFKFNKNLKNLRTGKIF